MSVELQNLTAMKEALRALESYARVEATITARIMLRAAIARSEEKYGRDAPYTFHASRKVSPMNAEYIEELA